MGYPPENEGDGISRGIVRGSARHGGEIPRHAEADPFELSAVPIYWASASS
jgi:hypothetical protein